MPGTPPALVALAAKVPAREYAMLTQDGEDVAQEAYDSAIAWAEGAASRSGVELDWALPELATALRKRFVYELYALSESEAVALDKKRDADDLIRSVLGDAAVGPMGGGETGPHSTPALPPAAAVEPGTNSDLVGRFKKRTA